MGKLALANANQKGSQKIRDRSNKDRPAKSAKVLDDVAGLVAHDVKLVVKGLIPCGVGIQAENSVVKIAEIVELKREHVHNHTEDNRCGSRIRNINQQDVHNDLQLFH